MQSKQKYLLYRVLILIVVVIIFIGVFIQNSPKTGDASNKSQLIGQLNNSDLPQFPSRIKSDKAGNISKPGSTPKIDSLNLPKFVHHNFIELDKISKISKFRSGVGHDFSRGINETESCRSMKHYFEPVGIDETFWSKYHEGKISKSDWPAVKYFSPVSGKIVDMRPAKNIFGEEENQFIIQSKEYPDIWFDFFHVITKEDIQVGSNVEEGEFLGTISAGNSGEIAVSINPNSFEQLVSFFDVIDDKVFLEYKARGVESRQDFIISKDERDKNPLKCDDEEPHRFIGNWFISNKEEYDNWSMGFDNWAFLKEN
jgi:hypothetical protein